MRARQEDTHARSHAYGANGHSVQRPVRRRVGRHVGRNSYRRVRRRRGQWVAVVVPAGYCRAGRGSGARARGGAGSGFFQALKSELLDLQRHPAGTVDAPPSACDHRMAQNGEANLVSARREPKFDTPRRAPSSASTPVVVTTNTPRIAHTWQRGSASNAAKVLPLAGQTRQ